MIHQLVNRVGGGLTEWCLDHLAPHRCVFCDLPSNRQVSICHVCEDLLTPNDLACLICALPDCHGAYCPDCQRHAKPELTILAPYVYNEALGYLMRRWKYHKNAYLAQTAAYLMLKESKNVLNDAIYLAIPLHWSRHIRRGFNQSEDLLAALRHQNRSTEHDPSATRPAARLLRTRRTRTQVGASRSERLAQLADVFALRGDVRERSVVLIDDVCTTGATAHAAAKILLSAGADRVHLWCLARTPPH